MDACAGIDIGGTNTVLGLVDAGGELLCERHLETTGHADFDAFVHSLAAELSGAVATCGAALRGIGIGAPNGNVHDGTIVYAPNLPWEGVLPVAERIGAAFDGIPVHLTNDANAAALGELLYGGARGLRDFVVVTLGTGVGGGFVSGGELVYGHDGLAGELGHVVVDWDGRPCGCGRRGCIEAYASVPGFLRTARELLDESEAPSDLRGAPELTGRRVSEAAAAGDAIAIETFERTGRWLGRALADAVAITSPERIFVFGGLARAGALLLEPAQRHLDESVMAVYRGKARLELSHLMDRNAAVLGAAALAWKRLELAR